MEAIINWRRQAAPPQSRGAAACEFVARHPRRNPVLTNFISSSTLHPLHFAELLWRGTSLWYPSNYILYKSHPFPYARSFLPPFGVISQTVSLKNDASSLHVSQHS